MSVRHPLLQFCSLIIALFLAFLVSLSALREYYLEMLALSALAYVLMRRFVFPHVSKATRDLLFASVMTFFSLDVVLSSGGLNSSYFFLVYFLLFALAIIVHPIVSLTTAVSVVAMFVSQMPTGTSLQQLTPLIALPFLVPFAVFLGTEHNNLMKERTIREQSHGDVLIFLSVVIKGHLNSLNEIVTGFRGDDDLARISRIIRRTKKLIDEYEKNS